jgi:hypothetical protein
VIGKTVGLAGVLVIYVLLMVCCIVALVAGAHLTWQIGEWVWSWS